jgi:ferrous iron transport protein B
MYLVGVVAAVPVTFLLKKTLLKSNTPSFLIELPPYRRPLMMNVIHRMYERAREFVVQAGTVILAVSVIIWALSYYPRPESVSDAHAVRVEHVNKIYAPQLAEAGVPVSEDAAAMPDSVEGIEEYAASLEGEVSAEGEEVLGARQAKMAVLEGQRDGAYLRESYLARMGHVIEPVVLPLGWDWRIGMATLASFPAREVIIATLGVIFDQGGDVDESDEGLITKIREAKHPDGRPLFTLPVALSIMVFFALCMQCAATLAAMKRETNSWRWPIFTFAYMTALAYVAAFATYHLFSWIV